MIKFGKWIAKHKVIIVIISMLLLIPSFLGMAATRVNYDILSYLPESLETVEGQDIMVDEFGMGAFSMVVVEDMELKDVAALKEKFQNVEHVKDVLWYDSVADLSIPVSMIPEKFKDGFFNGDATMMIALFDNTTSSDAAMEAVSDMRKIANEQCFISGMSGVVTDIKNLALEEMPIYVVIAACLSLLVLLLAMDSLVIPVLFLLSVGLAVVYNLGTNIFFGEVCYITKSLTAVLQLGVTMDYSIFLWGYTHYEVYYDLAGTLPGNLDSVIANDKLDETFAMNSTHIILCDSSLEPKEVNEMMSKIDDVDGVKATLGLDSLVGPTVPREMIPSDIKEVVMDENYQMLMISSEYKVASDEVNDQCDKIEKIMKKYDKNAMLIGEAPCTKDLITITNHDFNVVSTVSIGAIFLIIACVFKSISLPIILVAVIEFAIFINMGIPAFTGTKLPFIAGIVIGTIQLGATVDYAILMTTKYRKARYNGVEKQEAITSALGASMQSVIVSALSFFAATFGVGLYSNVDMIASLCSLMARGAIISMFVVIFILPSMFMIFDKIICKTSKGFVQKN